MCYQPMQRIIIVPMLSLFGLLVISPSLSAESGADYVALPPLLDNRASGDKPNVLVVLDNSNSMDEAPSGQAVGSSSPGSKSEIARNAVKNIITTFGNDIRMGLMAFQQSGITRRKLHDSQYDVSYNPANYDPTFDLSIPGNRASQTKAYRVPNPTNPGTFIYYNVALPFYSNGTGSSFCYSTTADFDNGSEVYPSGPWDFYSCFRSKTDKNDSIVSPSGFSSPAGGGTFFPTDSDLAQNILDFGTHLTDQFIGDTWFANTSPGGGFLHVAVADVDTTQRSLLNGALATSQFVTATDTPLRNAGLTPIDGTLQSARRYFSGTLASTEAGNSVSLTAPPSGSCGRQDYVVLVTDGLPSVDANGNGVSNTTAAINAAAATAASLLNDGVRTYVVGFALPPGVDASLLDTIAAAGGTGQTYLANDSTTLNAALSSIFLSLTKGLSSSSSVAVLANNRRGEGAIFQSLYSPEETDNLNNTVTWVGDVQGLFIDSLGLLREDTNANQTLDDYSTDRVIQYFFNDLLGKTQVNLYLGSGATPPVLDGSTSPYATVDIDEVKAIWRAKEQLATLTNVSTQRTYTDAAGSGRYIITSVNGTTAFPFVPNTDPGVQALVDAEATALENRANAQQILTVVQAQFDAGETTAANLAVAQAALTAADESYQAAVSATAAFNTNYASFTAHLDSNSAAWENLINYIRGAEVSGYRSRTIDFNNDGLTEIWRLGDIVHSSPVVVGAPGENYDSLYQDSTYAAFREHYKYRRQVIYTGANDGMLHAFNVGFWNESAKKFELDNRFVTPASEVTRHPLGSELWAYIPRAALPHLQWLTDPNYAHSYYVDGEPIVFDANIFTADASHPFGWGTVLMVGMRFGGGAIAIDSNTDGTDDLILRSSYMLFDITNPEEAPVLIAEISDDDLGFTTSIPAVIKARVKDADFVKPARNEWKVIFGSGPTELNDATSQQNAKIFVYDLIAKEFVKNLGPLDLSLHPNSFVGDMSVYDEGSNFVDDTVYFGLSFGVPSPTDTSSGVLKRARLDQPAESLVTTLIDLNEPVISAPLVTRNNDGRRWVSFGTGRLLVAPDNTTKNQQSFFGVMEPTTNGTMDWGEVSLSEIENVTTINVDNGGNISTTNNVTVEIPQGNEIKTFNQLVAAITKHRSGWQRDLAFSNNNPSGRSLSSPAISNTVLFFAEYTPSTNACTPEGTSQLFAVDFRTGTALPFDVFDFESSPGDTSTLSIDLGQGLFATPAILNNSGNTGGTDTSVTTLNPGSTGGATLGRRRVGIYQNSRNSWRQLYFK